VLSLADAAFALQAPGRTSVRDMVSQGLWPPLAPPAPGIISVRAIARRYGEAGKRLRQLDTGTANVWGHMNRSGLVGEARARIRDPGIIRQQFTGLCGPLAVVFELARRRPEEFVRATIELVESGKFTTLGGRVIEAEEELRDEVPTAPAKTPPWPPIADIDWLFAATLRDDENIVDDVDDDANGWESITLWGAMRDWTHNVLGLTAGWKTTLISGEMDAMRWGQDAIDAGGVAFLLVDSFLLRDGGNDDEEDMHWRKRRHIAGQSLEPFGPQKHSLDDDSLFPPDHWVAYLGASTLKAQVSLTVWCWGEEYRVTGSDDSLGEYLYAVVRGRP
jgi:hypothetical protein